MKQFFYVLFGGLASIFCGILIAYGARFAWQNVGPALMQIRMPSFSYSYTLPKMPSISAPSFSKMKSSVRYTANEEEDLINAATVYLASSVSGKVTSTAYLVKNLTDNSIDVDYNADKLLPIASLTKLVTAVVVRKAIDPDERVLITKSITSTYGNTAGFKIGETFRASDLMYPLLMVSSNDSAEALAQDYGRPRFIEAMNEFAQSIGAYRTNFYDASGLSPKNTSTARDLAIILDWIRINDPAIIDITMIKSKTIRSHTWTNPAHFLSWSNYLGGKNGYTDEANRTGVALFKMGKNRDVYAVVVLGSSARDADVVNLLDKVKD